MPGRKVRARTRRSRIGARPRANAYPQCCCPARPALRQEHACRTWFARSLRSRPLSLFSNLLPNRSLVEIVQRLFGHRRTSTTRCWPADQRRPRPTVWYSNLGGVIPRRPTLVAWHARWCWSPLFHRLAAARTLPALLCRPTPGGCCGGGRGPRHTPLLVWLGPRPAECCARLRKRRPRPGLAAKLSRWCRLHFPGPAAKPAGDPRSCPTWPRLRPAPRPNWPAAVLDAPPRALTSLAIDGINADCLCHRWQQTGVVC